MTAPTESDGASSLRLKHFNPGLKGWEEKTSAASIAFSISTPDPTTIVFQPRSAGSVMVYKRPSPSEMTIDMNISEDGKTASEQFKLSRVEEGTPPPR